MVIIENEGLNYCFEDGNWSYVCRLLEWTRTHGDNNNVR
jgi:hypothetical protein